jgi:hypothetical protein
MSNPPFELGVTTFVETYPDPHTGDLTSHGDRLRQVVEEAQAAEAAGLDIYGVGEHHREDFAASAPAVVLGVIAGSTRSIRLTSAVTVLSSDDPVRVFQDFATLDQLSSGRAEIIAGRGSFTESFPLFGYDLPWPSSANLTPRSQHMPTGMSAMPRRQQQTSSFRPIGWRCPTSGASEDGDRFRGRPSTLPGPRMARSTSETLRSSPTRSSRPRSNSDSSASCCTSASGPCRTRKFCMRSSCSAPRWPRWCVRPCRTAPEVFAHVGVECWHSRV